MKSIVHFTLFALPAVLFQGTSIVAQPTTIDQMSLDINKAMWEEQNIKNYIFSLTETFNGWEPTYLPWRIQVSNDQYPQQKKTIDNRNVPRLTGVSVEDVYTEIQDAINGNADYLQVFYDPVMGFPRRTIVRYGPNMFIRNIEAMEINAYSPKMEHMVNTDQWKHQNIKDYNFDFTQINTDFHTAWPLKIQVRNNAITSIKDSNGQDVHNYFHVVQSFDGFMTTIQNQLDMDAPFVDIEYNRRGFPSNIFMVTRDDGILDYRIGSFDTNIPTPYNNGHLRH